MAGRPHVLLIGIDAYDGGGMLTGCVNDIDAVQRLLIDRVGVPAGQIKRLAAPRSGEKHETDVPEALPTLDRLRAELTRLGTAAVGPEDHVLVYYSGHGTQCLVADPSGRRFSREALLPKDKVRMGQLRLLFDWEVNALLVRIAERAAAVTVILDCCSAAGVTRDVPEAPDVYYRFWECPADYRLEAGEAGPADLARGVAVAVARVPHCLVVAACLEGERARESRGDSGPAHGELTRALMLRLTALPQAELADLRWGRIWRAVAADVRAVNPRQNPWISGSFGRRVFGAGGDEPYDPGYAVTQADDLYRLDAGTLAGVTEDARIAVYGTTPALFPPLNTSADLATRHGVLRVVRADRATCEATAVTPFALPEGARGRLCKAGRDARLRVALKPHDDELASRLKDSPLVELVTDGDAELVLERRHDGAWALTDDVHGTGATAGEPVLAAIPADWLDLARVLVEHYHAYLAPLKMARGCRDLPNLLRLWLLDCNGRTVTPEQAQSPDLPQVQAGKRAPYELTVGDRVCFVVENGADVELAVTLLDCGAAGGVSRLGYKPVPAGSRHVFWFQNELGKPFAAGLVEKDRVLGVDRIVAIGTTRADLHLQFLESPVTFAELLSPTKGKSREMGAADAGERSEQWTSAMTAIRISRPTS
jgi:hypothetical protein